MMDNFLNYFKSNDNTHGTVDFCPMRVNEDNNMPILPNEPINDVKLNTSRKVSSIPRAGYKSNWVYPSPMQFYNALIIKNEAYEDPKYMEDAVNAHNDVNEQSWKKILEWEKMHKSVLSTIEDADPEADNTRGLSEALDTEKTGVKELYYYKKGINEEVLKLRKNSNYYIYYYNNNNNWKKQNTSPVTDAKEAAVSTVINNELSNMVEIQLEKNSENYGLVDVNDKRINVGPATVTVDGYTGYKHQQGASAARFTIEKVRHGGTQIRGFPATISGVSEFNVYYKTDDLTRPLFVYFQTSESGPGTKPHKYYARGLVWWRLIREKDNTLTAAELKTLFEKEMLKVDRHGRFLELIFFTYSLHLPPIYRIFTPTSPFISLYTL